MSLKRLVSDRRFLPRLLRVDAAATGATGLLLLTAAGTLAPLLNLPVGLQRIAGAICVLFAAWLLLLARREGPSRGAMKAVVAVNVAWVVASVWVAFGGFWQPSLFGVAFVMAQALVVLAFADLGWFGLRAAAGTPRGA